ncbi:cell wall hydrolase [Sediminibacillus massiliensis]|uniref:cell wall hydrolase n=1 Tax=Sediminibacillus massiliensis TaxID=1926277 RepID=UPI0009888F4B|nr:cell wall hydrolase [Sediminibacillus massiliensis]
MKKHHLSFLAAALIVGYLAIPISADASIINNEEDSWNISTYFADSPSRTEKVQVHKQSSLNPSKKKDLPPSISAEEKNLMARLVHAEAEGESYKGKVAVATVVLNRVEHEGFPDSIKEVVYQRTGKVYAFSPVQNGSINQLPGEDSVKAVEEALTNGGQNNDSLYFYNPKTAKSEWILTRKVTHTIGNHRFAE